MASKPPQLANFVPGKVIDTVENACATLNWLVSCMAGMTGKDGVKVEGVQKGEIVIKGDGAGGVKVTSESGSYNAKQIVFESASDSNVTFNLSESDGTVTVTVGVHWAN